ncbi:MAG: glycosyltransferase family 39 protein [Candidatus Bathyarchaeia archaeon]
MQIQKHLGKISHDAILAILIVVVAKILVFTVGLAANALAGSVSASTLFTMFNRWDAPHYLDIAQNWYVNTGDPANFIVFFPLYPILIRLITVNFDYINISALIVANVCSLIGFFYLYKLAKLEFNSKVAVKAVLFMSIFPMAYFLSAPYTEGLFFALVIASIYYARVSRWEIAGLLSMFAALSRLAGLLLLPVLLVEYFHQKGWKPRNVDYKIVWATLAAAGFLIYLAINLQVTGEAFKFMEIQKVHWFNTLDPITGLKLAWSWATTRAYPENFSIGIAPITFAVFGLVMFIAAVWKRFRPVYLVYMFLTWGLAVSTSWWISVPRYIMAMFPMFILLGALTRNKAVNVAIATAFLVGLVYFAATFALGWWAF